MANLLWTYSHHFHDSRRIDTCPFCGHPNNCPAQHLRDLDQIWVSLNLEEIIICFLYQFANGWFAYFMLESEEHFCLFHPLRCWTIPQHHLPYQLQQIHRPNHFDRRLSIWQDDFLALCLVAESLLLQLSILDHHDCSIELSWLNQLLQHWFVNA